MPRIATFDFNSFDGSSDEDAEFNRFKESPNRARESGRCLNPPWDAPFAYWTMDADDGDEIIIPAANFTPSGDVASDGSLVTLSDAGTLLRSDAELRVPSSDFTVRLYSALERPETTFSPSSGTRYIFWSGTPRSSSEVDGDGGPSGTSGITGAAILWTPAALNDFAFLTFIVSAGARVGRVSTQIFTPWNRTHIVAIFRTTDSRMELWANGTLAEGKDAVPIPTPDSDDLGLSNKNGLPLPSNLDGNPDFVTADSLGLWHYAWSPNAVLCDYLLSGPDPKG